MMDTIFADLNLLILNIVYICYKILFSQTVIHNTMVQWFLHDYQYKCLPSVLTFWQMQVSSALKIKLSPELEVSKGHTHYHTMYGSTYLKVFTMVYIF